MYMQVQGVVCGVPRIISLALYVPEVYQGLPDWDITEELNEDQVKGQYI